ncbi:unnamed protein product, partial [Mesorhabditis spiculigera]
MIGWVHITVSTLIIRKYGLEVWKEIKRKAGFSDETEFEVQQYYDDSDTFRIFRAAAATLGVSVDDMWELYGDHLITYASETGWNRMLACMADNLQDFLDNLNSMHYFIDQIAFKSEMKGPSFQCEDQGDGTLRLHYFSNRQGLYPIVKGLVRKTAKYLFDIEVSINVLERQQERRKSGLVEHVIFSVGADERHKEGERLAHRFRRNNRSQLEMVPETKLLRTLSTKDFNVIFPFHICFNKQMIVEHVGQFILCEYALADKKMVKLTDVVQLVQPADIQLTFKNILSYLNTLFIFQMRHHARRNEQDATCSVAAFQQPLCLKGQMYPLAEGNTILFLCSPHVTTVRDILNLNLCISDMPMHDATRDLVMLNQSRICQMELNKKLEDTVRRLRGMAEELETKKGQTDRLLFEFVPAQIADALRNHKPVQAQEFGECAVLSADMPDFPTINVHCKPAQMIELITDLFHRFDRLIDLHKCYKVLSLMDSYLVVCGVPAPCERYCEKILNLALGMILEARLVIVPELNLSVRLRIGVHVGPVVTGIVSQKKPRYCVLGETVAITKAICEHNDAGKILVSNAARTMVTKGTKQQPSAVFVFASKGYVDIGTMKMLTHYLERNEKMSAWEITDRPKGEEQTIDGYRELHTDEGAREWEEAREHAQRAIRVLDAMKPLPSEQGTGTLQKLKAIKKRLGTGRSSDSHDLTCAQYCRNNIEPTTGAQRVCASFNFDGRETCYFFDDAAAPAGTGQLTANPSANNFYYEKTCLPAVTAHEACTYRSFSFERMRKTILEGFVKKTVQVSGREQCLSTCLKEKEFVCRSVNYNHDTYMCELNAEDRRSKPTALSMTDINVDYYDNNCLSRQNRCGQQGGNLVFVKTTNFEIHFYDHTQSVEAQESYCLQKCLDSLNTFCRSVEFSPNEKNCIVSDEDTFSRADQQGQVQAKDYYEPICVAADLSSSTCRQQAAFERFIGSSIEGEVVASAQGVTVSDCISLCFQNLNCKSINYDRTASSCFIYAVGRADANIKANPSMDYYEFNCESQFGGMALCTNDGIRFIVNTKEPYTGAIYAAERFSTCSQVVENAKQISITFPPPDRLL